MTESFTRRFMRTAIKKAEIDEFLSKKLKDAGYGGFFIDQSSAGMHITIYAMRPGMVIGRAGTGVKELERKLSEKFGIRNLTVAVAGIEIPELNPYVMASRVARALERGIHFRRAGFWALNTIMNAGALGAEVIISGKLRTERATYEKYRAGYLAKAGKPAEGVEEATVDVQLKPGVYGIKVRIMPPTAPIVDRSALRSLEFLRETPTKEAPVGGEKKSEEE